MTCPSCQAETEAGASACGHCGHALTPHLEVRPGFLLASRYEIHEALGRGGMGMVYKAHDRLLHESVAIKVLRPDVAETAETAQRFISEIKLARSVSHRNVCRIHEYGEDRGIRYISMAFVDGIDVRRVLHERGALRTDEAYDVAIQAAEGLHAIHEEGIIHRDLKTPNLMLDSRGVVRLMDFGIAKQWTDESAASVTGTGQMIGTPEYMSPEQVRGEKLDRRSDVYGLGTVIFELFTGHTPFRGETPLATILKHLNELPPMSGPDAAGLPAAIIPVVRRALAKNREERFATAQQVAEALKQARDASAAAAPTFVPDLRETVPAPGGPRETDFLPDVERWPTQPLDRKPALVPLADGSPPARPEPTRATARLVPPRRPRAVAAALVAVVAAGAAYLALQRAPEIQDPAHITSPASLTPGTTPTPVPSNEANTTIPQPNPSAASQASTAPGIVPRAVPTTPAPAGGDKTTGLRAARTAFDEGRYEEAARRAGAVLEAEPRNAEAARLVRQATDGQKADGHFRAAVAAIERRDYGEATSQVQAGRSAAPWDARGAQLAAKLQEGQQAQGRDMDARVDALLAEAEKLLTAQNYDAAIAGYDEILKLDPRNSIARLSRAVAVNARVTAQAAVPKPVGGRSFVAGKSHAESAETRPDASLTSGFETSPGITVTRDTQAAALPGRIEFKAEPETIRAGDKYAISIYLRNTGVAPIELKDMVLTATVNGRKASGAVPPLTRNVAPGQSGLLFTLSDVLKDDAKTWSLEAIVRTTRGEGYSNQLTWK